MNNLSGNVSKQLSINGKGYPFFKKRLFQKTKFFAKLSPIRTNFETMISHAKFIYCWRETFKVGLYTTKSTLSINSFYKFPFSRDLFRWQVLI